MPGMSRQLLYGGRARVRWVGSPACRGCGFGYGESYGYEFRRVRGGSCPGVEIVCKSCGGWWWADLPEGFREEGWFSGVRLSCVAEGVHEGVHEEVAGEAQGPISGLDTINDDAVEAMRAKCEAIARGSHSEMNGVQIAIAALKDKP